MGVEIGTDIYAAVQTLGEDTVMELAQGLNRARRLHPEFAGDAKTAANVVYGEAYELECAAHQEESPDRQHAEALDTAVTAIRFMKLEWLPKFGAEAATETSEDYFCPAPQVWGEEASESRSELSEHVCWVEESEQVEFPAFTGIMDRIMTREQIRATAGAKADPVNHPSHYTAYPVEVIDMIRQVLGDCGFKAYCLGNEIKYRMRAGLKGDANEDLAKAMKYKEFRDAVG